MRILTFKRFVVLAAVGGVAYTHKQRGGVWTLESIKETLRQLWSSAADRLAPTAGERETLTRASQVGETSTRTGYSDEVQGAYGGYKRNETPRR